MSHRPSYEYVLEAEKNKSCPTVACYYDAHYGHFAPTPAPASQRTIGGCP
jgi:hypothetical protein